MPGVLSGCFYGGNMRQESNFTAGKILSPLIRFMVPVFLAMFLQSMYGAVDLLIVGKFAHSVDVSAVSTGSQIMMTLTNLVTSFAMGTTILLGQRIGEGRGREGGHVIDYLLQSAWKHIQRDRRFKDSPDDGDDCVCLQYRR